MPTDDALRELLEAMVKDLDSLMAERQNEYMFSHDELVRESATLIGLRREHLAAALTAWLEQQ